MKKGVICTVESEPEFEYPIELRGNRLAKHILQSHTPRKEARDQTWDCFLYETATSRESEVYIPGQVTDETSRQLSSKHDRCQYFRMDVRNNPERRSASPRADGGEPEEIGRIGQAAKIAFDPTDQSQISAYRPKAAARAATQMATRGQAATCSTAKAAASSISDGGRPSD